MSRCFDAESARRLLEVRLDPTGQIRIEERTAKANDGALTVADDLMSISGI